MLKRKCYDRPIEWESGSNGKTAMLAEGTRRAGKTTLVRAFAESEYEDSIYIDFSNTPRDVADLLREGREGVGSFLRMLQLYYAKRLPERESVAIFDEILRLPAAREYVKRLVPDGRFDHIEEGSLISIRKSVEGIVIPSEEERVTLYPLGFGVYADAVREASPFARPLPDAVHSRIMGLFDERMLVGGPPQSVEAFAGTADFAPCFVPSPRSSRRRRSVSSSRAQARAGATGTTSPPSTGWRMPTSPALAGTAPTPR